MSQIELRRHAQREPHADRLSPTGRAQAEDGGRAAGPVYTMVFVSPAGRAAETAAWWLRGAGQQLPDHEVILGLAGQDATGGTPEGMAAGIRALLDRSPPIASTFYHALAHFLSNRLRQTTTDLTFAREKNLRYF